MPQQQTILTQGTCWLMFSSRAINSDLGRIFQSCFSCREGQFSLSAKCFHSQITKSVVVVQTNYSDNFNERFSDNHFYSCWTQNSLWKMSTLQIMLDFLFKRNDGIKHTGKIQLLLFLVEVRWQVKVGHSGLFIIIIILKMIDNVYIFPDVLSSSKEFLLNTEVSRSCKPPEEGFCSSEWQ